MLALLAALAIATASGRAQVAATPATGDTTTVSLVAGREPVTLLTGTWRFQPGDDARWSAAGFDDSQWKLLRSDKPWSEQGYKGLSGYAWYRFKIELPVGDDAYTLLLPSIHTSYQCFVDGKLLRTTGAFPPSENILYRAAPVSIELPNRHRSTPQTLQVAIRVWHSPVWAQFVGGGVVATDPPVGRVGEATLVADYFRLRNLAQRHNVLASLGIGIIDVLAALASLVLYLYRRTAREYLWFAVCTFAGATHPIITYARIDRIWNINTMDTLSTLASTVSELALLALLRRLLNAPTDWLLRLAVGCVLLDLAIFFPAEYLNAISFGASNVTHVILVLPVLAWIAVLITRRVREGMLEARLLLLPFGFLVSLAAFNLVIGAFTTLGHPLGWSPNPLLLEYPFPVQLNDIQDVVLLLGMLAILVNRFARTSREQERVSGELRAARSLQQLMIPEALPQVAGLEIAAAYHPAHEVGGDFFQIIPLKSGQTLVVVGDVSGKGLAAAMTVSLAVGAIRTMAEVTESPGEVLAGLNRRLCGRGGFTTCLALRISPTGEITLANAGHLAPYLNGCEVETEPALPLGLDFEAGFAETTLRMCGKDQLTILTDGVPEAEKERELFGFARTENLSTQGATYIADAARSFGQNDDITVLTIVRGG